EEMTHLLVRAEFHDPFDAGAVVPAPVEDDDFAGRGEMREIPLDLHLRLFAFRRRGERDDAKDARTDALGDGLDGAPFTRYVPPFEQDADLESLVLDPLLQFDQLDVQLFERPLVLLSLELLALRRTVILFSAHYYIPDLQTVGTVEHRFGPSH